MILLISAVQQEFNPDCDVAFQEFVEKFNKSYDEGKLSEARDVFCHNYHRMLQLIKENKCPDCGVTEVMDRTLNELVTTRVSENRKRIVVVDGTEKPTKNNNYYIDTFVGSLPWPTNLKIYSSIDLREAGIQGKAKDQGTCGSCWAFGVTAVLEGLILTDQQWGLPYKHPAWNYTAETCNLSEQFIMSNIWDASDYCAGGNFVSAIDYMTRKFKTVETAEHYPNKFNLNYRNWELKNGLEPKLYPWEYYLPFYTFGPGKQYSLIKIYHDNERPISSNPKARNQVMQAISRGIPVSGVMAVPDYLIYYTGQNVPDEPCHGQQVNHQITFVGYGKKGGLNVWLVRNSWGESWGAKGYFFLEREKNSFCSEMSFYTVLPQYQGTKQNALKNPGIREKHQWSLDYEVPELIDPDPNSLSGFALSYALVIGSSLVAVCIGAIIAVAIAFISRRRKHVYKTKQEQVYALE